MDESCVDIAACYSENVPKSMFGAAAITDEDFESGKVQPVNPDWYVCCIDDDDDDDDRS